MDILKGDAKILATKKEIRGVIVPRHDTAINWSKAVNFTPENGELIIISADNATDVARGYYLDSEGNKLTSITVNSNGVNKVCTIKPSDKVRFKFGNGKDNVNALPFQTEAIQGTASGSVIQIDDISPVTHEMSIKISSDTVEDLTAVKVSRCGKNLCVDVSDRTDVFLSGSPTTTYSITGGQLIKGFAVNGNATNYHITDFVNSNGAVSFKTSNVSYTIGIDVEVVEGVTYAVSANITGGTSESKPIWTVFLKDGLFQSYTTAQSFTVPNNCNQAILLIRPSAANTECSFSNVQLELGTTATEYEKYIAPTDYTPTADGTVNGVTSLYPNTTLMTDTDGVLIDCEYLTNNYKPVLDNRIPKQTQSDWQQNDETANDYVKNRPGGYDRLTEILPETTLNFTDSFSLSLTNCPLLEVGREYIVTFYHPNSDNTEYKLIGKNDFKDSPVVYIGNETYTWGGTDTGEPFLIYNMNSDNNPTIYISSSTTLPCTYNIKIKAIIPIKIDEKYLDIKNTNIVNGGATGSLRTVGSESEIEQYAFAEGKDTTASGYASHAEGKDTTASGYISHAEGTGTTASGYISHAEGFGTTASGRFSHAEGKDTTASGDYQHVQGKFNIADTTTTYADIIGNGSSNTKRSNAATVDWNGNAWYAGDVYVGSTSGTNKDEGSKKLATEEYIDKKIVDYIIEEGVSPIWTYRKWNSGIAECWGKFAAITELSSQWAGYYTANLGSIDYPAGLFSEPPILNAILKAANFPGHLFFDGELSKSKTGAIGVACHNERQIDGYLHLSAKGVWK